MSLLKHIDTYGKVYYMTADILKVRHYDLIGNHCKDGKSNVFPCFALVMVRELLNE